MPRRSNLFKVTIKREHELLSCAKNLFKVMIKQEQNEINLFHGH